jgi:hypothetical protein
MRAPLVLVGTLLLGGCDAFDFNPLETDQREAGIELEVVGCERDDTSGVARAVVELTSEREYQTVLLQAELSDESGVVIATTSSSVVGVNPGRTYRKELVFGGIPEPEGAISCDVTFDFASEGFGD